MLNPEEKQIVEYGKEKGKTQEQVIQALAKYRTLVQKTQTPPAEEKGAFGQVLETGKQRVGEIATETAQGKITKGEAVLQTAGAVADSTLGLIFSVPVIKQVAGVLNTTVEAARDLIKAGADRVVSAIPEDVRQSYALAPQDKPTPEGAKRLKEDTEAALSLVNLGMTVYGGAESLSKVRPVVSGMASKVTSGVQAGVEGVKGVVGKTKGFVEGVKNKISSAMEKPVPKATETALKGTKTETFDKYTEAARKAVESYKNPTPLEMAGGKAQQALDTIQRKLEGFGTQKSQVLNQASVGNKPVGNIVLKFRQDMGNFLKSKTTVEGDTALIRRITSEAEKLGANPNALQVDKFIDFAQNEIYSSGRNLSVPVTDSITGGLRSLVGKLNNSLKAQLPESYRGLNQKYAETVKVRNELNDKLGKEGEKGGALMKRVFSPSDAGTKKLFEQVLKLTGVDLVNEATVARFLMETIGDARQVSILENLKLPNLSNRGVFQLALDYVSGKINTPEQIISRARELTQ